MGMYLGQLPPAEIARLKAELAETLVANFCYPRFFDYRTDSLRTRPVSRAKRQEVWLYLSSFDFTAWNRVDLMSAEFQHCIERLFIQFVQRNRSFFGEQGRRRMFDIRTLIGSCAATVVQGMHAHLSGHKQGSFGSPRPVVNWSAPPVNGYTEPAWEQISATTALLQQQLQELRGEEKPSGERRQAPVQSSRSQTDGRVATNNGSEGTVRTTGRSQPLRNPSGDLKADGVVRATSPASPVQQSQPVSQSGSRPAGAVPPAAGGRSAAVPPAQSRPSGSLESSSAGSLSQPGRRTNPLMPPESEPLPPTDPSLPRVRSTSALSPTDPSLQPTLAEPLQVPSAGALATSQVVRSNGPQPQQQGEAKRIPSSPLRASSAAPLSPNAVPVQAPAPPLAVSGVAGGVAAQRGMMTIGEDDLAIFEQMRHQLLLWLRLEAVKAGLEIAGQTPPQLLDALRQQARFDETRLQVVSTLLNLSNQVIKTGLVSILDYKQALLFFLMHTRQ